MTNETHRVELIGKPDCHLCSEARLIVQRVCDELNVHWVELSIYDDPALADQFAEFIPVVRINGKPFDQFGVSETRLRTALATGS